MVNADQTRLPSEFDSLSPFAETWALATEMSRANQRWKSDYSDIKAFYDAMVPELGRVLDYLNQFDLEGLTPEQKNLFHLSLSLAEIADAVEAFRESAVPYAFSPEKFRPVE